MTAVKNMLQKRNLRKSIAYAGISPIMILKSIDPRKVRHEGAFIFFFDWNYFDQVCVPPHV